MKSKRCTARRRRVVREMMMSPDIEPRCGYPRTARAEEPEAARTLAANRHCARPLCSETASART